MTLFTKPKLGSWKLTDLIEDPKKTQFQEFLQHIEAIVKQLELKRKDLNPKISATDFENLLHLIEDISEKVNVASGYASLRYAADTSSNESASLVTKMEIMRSNITNRLLFFDLWFKKDIDEENAQRLIASIPSVYQEYLKHKRLLAKYTLTEPEEKIISTLEVTGANALVKIYDRMTSAFEFVMAVKKGKKVVKKIFPNKEKMLSLIRSPKPEEREAAYRSLLHVYKKNSGVLGEIYQNLVIQWHEENISMRGFQSPISVRNISNNLDDTTVETLLSVCRRNSVVFQDYFKEKANMLVIKKLQRYHIYAPLSLKNSEQ
jgi:oligoendopeptidase F